MILAFARDVLWEKLSVKGSGMVGLAAAAAVGGAAALSWSLWAWIAFGSVP